MAAHRLAHPEPIPECFGCRVLGIGFQGLMSRASDLSATRAGVKPDPTRNVAVVADDGPHRGKSTGHHTDHWDGRRDATVRAPVAALQLNMSEERR